MRTIWIEEKPLARALASLEACWRGELEEGPLLWVTCYPDLHTGVDALSAIRSRDRLALDQVEAPAAVLRAMRQMTALWESGVETVSAIILPAGQGTSNWTMGWSSQHFLCIGQSDFACMISPQMFEQFCGTDKRECCDHADWTLYHLDGPGAIRHVPYLLQLEKLHCIQWIQGAGQRPPSQWLELLRQIQAGGKSVQLHYGDAHGGDVNLKSELDILCRALDPNRLFIWAQAASAEQAEAVLAYARKAARENRS